jgi:uncharacterized protein (DUF58 family)
MPGAGATRPQQPPDELLDRRRTLYYGAVILWIVGVIASQPLIFVAGLFVFILAFVPELWYRFCLRDLTIRRTPATNRIMVGDTVEMRLEVVNGKALPLPWIELADESPDAFVPVRRKVGQSTRPNRVVLTHTLALWAYQRVRRRYTLRAHARGAYRFGPMTVRVTDPFGMLTRQSELETPATLLVHPLLVPLDRLDLPPAAPFGEQRASRRLVEDPLRVVGIREYVLGDEPRRIHWKATARTGQLQSKVYEASARRTVAILLDIRTTPRLALGYDEPLAELAICAAASVARWCGERGYAVGVYSNGPLAAVEMADDAEMAAWGAPAPRGDGAEGEGTEAAVPRTFTRGTAMARLRLPPAARPEQLTRILDGLARLLPYYGRPMHEVLAAEERRLPAGADLVYIGVDSMLDVPTILALRRARMHGHAVTLLLTRGSPGFNGDPSPPKPLAGLVTHSLGGRERWDELLAAAGARRSDRPVQGPRDGQVAENDDGVHAEAGIAGGRTLVVD